MKERMTVFVGQGLLLLRSHLFDRAGCIEQMVKENAEIISHAAEQLGRAMEVDDKGLADSSRVREPPLSRCKPPWVS